ncbi:MAG: UDP-N-acetylmuramoyl-L-alanine--D-glutamate ligase [Campylobacterota bacterium]|nr:UDP-N-acetylmuramoyl-L-alanine--D-glutamate ligase [Campylobacterota bacterium]
MLSKLIDELKTYNSIGIFGFGKEGRSFYDFALKYLKDIQIVIIDKANGDNYLDDLKKVDLIIKSPGISLYKLGIEYNQYNFTSMSELFIRYFAKQIIGITGTKGKSTLCTILYNLFKNNNQDVKLCGNIGLPSFDILEELELDTVVVMELSSHQLSNIKYSPHIAILTNIFDDHLDYYKSKFDYYDSKFNIFRYQSSDDISIINCNTKCKKIVDNKKDIFHSTRVLDVTKDILKYQNKFNIKSGYIHLATLQILEAIVDINSIDKYIYQKTLNEFKTLHHRLEYVDKIDGIVFINDSISTIPEATIEAINILKDVNSVIIGGYDRGIQYSDLVNFLLNSDVSNIILYSQTGLLIKKLFNKVNNKKTIYYTKDLKSAVVYAKDITKNDTICLFSPAASSFDCFKNFEQRGEYFKTLVNNKI